MEPTSLDLKTPIPGAAGQKIDRITLKDATYWYELPNIIDGTESWVILNETASQSLYVAHDPDGDPNRNSGFSKYFSLAGFGTPRSSINGNTRPKSIWVKATAVNQVVVLIQLAKDNHPYGGEDRKLGEPGRKW